MAGVAYSFRIARSVCAVEVVLRNRISRGAWRPKLIRSLRPAVYRLGVSFGKEQPPDLVDRSMVTERRQYDLHGFVFDSDLPLDADRADEGALVVHGHRRVRLVVRRALPTPRDVVRVLLQWQSNVEGEGVLELVSTADGSLVFSFGGCRMRISADLSFVEVAPGDEQDLGWLAVLVEGWMVAIMVFLSGRTVLHASSVVIDGKLVAFVGNSTQGKSTMAAGFCASGATLFGDDVLAVEPVAGDPTRIFSASRGSNALRLRHDAALFVGPGTLGPSRPVGDRTVFMPHRDVPPQLPLEAIVIPWVSKEYSEPSLTKLSRQIAAVELMQYPRVFQWIHTVQRAQEFAGVAALANIVPVFHLKVPSGPSWVSVVFDLVTREVVHGILE